MHFSLASESTRCSQLADDRSASRSMQGRDRVKPGNRLRPSVYQTLLATRCAVACALALAKLQFGSGRFQVGNAWLDVGSAQLVPVPFSLRSYLNALRATCRVEWRAHQWRVRVASAYPLALALGQAPVQPILCLPSFVAPTFSALSALSLSALSSSKPSVK